MEEITSTHSVEAIDDFSSLNPLDTNGDYFTDADISWISYSSGGLNTSRSLLGAFAYGEGYVIFVGNSSMLNTWSQLDDFTTLLLSWGLPPVSISTTIVNCPEQSP